MITMELHGFDEAVRMFQKLGEVGEQALYKAMVETAIEGTTAMKQNSPVVTNRLRSSMHFETPSNVEYFYSDKLGRGFSGGFSFKPTGLAVAFGTNVVYAKAANEKSSKTGFFEIAQKRAMIVLPQRLKINYQKAIDKLVK